MNSTSAAETLAYEPDRTMRELIGENIDLRQEIFTPERIAAGQKTVNDARAGFFEMAEKELAHLENIVSTGATLDDEALFDSISRSALNVKGQAEMTGYRLVASIAAFIAAYCDTEDNSPQARRLIIADLVRLLGIAIHEKIADNNGAIAQKLSISLKKY
ncbi:MAG: hypothetical protein AB7H77_04095 [Bdellovibrionales bacterium]